MVGERSPGLIVSVLAAIGLGISSAYALPAYAIGSFDPSLMEFADAMVLGWESDNDGWLMATASERGWVVDLARAGVILAIVSAIAFSRARWLLQAFCISVGALATMPLIFWLGQEIANAEAVGLARPRPGWVLTLLSFVLAAVIPWVRALLAFAFRSRSASSDRSAGEG